MCEIAIESHTNQKWMKRYSKRKRQSKQRSLSFLRLPALYSKCMLYQYHSRYESLVIRENERKMRIIDSNICFDWFTNTFLLFLGLDSDPCLWIPSFLHACSLSFHIPSLLLVDALWVSQQTDSPSTLSKTNQLLAVPRYSPKAVSAAWQVPHTPSSLHSRTPQSVPPASSCIVLSWNTLWSYMRVHSWVHSWSHTPFAFHESIAPVQ